MQVQGGQLGVPEMRLTAAIIDFRDGLEQVDGIPAGALTDLQLQVLVCAGDRLRLEGAGRPNGVPITDDWYTHATRSDVLCGAPTTD